MCLFLYEPLFLRLLEFFNGKCFICFFQQAPFEEKYKQKMIITLELIRYFLMLRTMQKNQ